MMLPKRTLFGVMQCIYAVRGSKIHYFLYIIIVTPLYSAFCLFFYKAHRSEKRGVL